MRYLCIDLGDKRTGLAVADSVMRIVSPLDVIEVAVTADRGESLLSAIVRAVEGQFGVGGRTAGELVVGLPLNMDGTEGPRAKGVRALAAKIAERTGRVVHFHDERLSTAEADWSMARSGLTRGQKKAKRDAIAAAAILRDFLAAQAGARDEGGTIGAEPGGGGWGIGGSGGGRGSDAADEPG